MKNFSTKDMVFTALFAAIFCILAPFSIPIGEVPVSVTNFLIYITIYAIGWKKATVSYIIYLLLGFVGLPVFAGFTGGFQYIVGYSGGFIISFPLVAFIIGFVSEKTDNMVLILLSTILGLIVSYTIGTLVFSLVTNASISASLAACVIPFIFTDLLKCFIATVIGLKLKENISIKSVLN